MTRAQLEHLIGAAATIADDTEVVVIGSQAILGSLPDAPAELCTSMEADLWPRNHPELWEVIDGAIGELSLFHDTFGYYAQGVGPETATLPAGWDERLVPVTSEATRGATGLCLEMHDLLVSKYVAGRDKDFAFIRAAMHHGLVDRDVLLARVALTPISPDRQAHVAALIDRHLRESAGGSGRAPAATPAR